MTFSPETLLQLILVLPLLGAAGIAITGRNPNLRESVTFITAGIIFGLVIQLYYTFTTSDSPIELHLLSLFPGLDIQFKLEPLGMIFALIAGFLWLITSLYGVGYMRGNNEQHQTRFFFCFPIAISATLGIAFAGNLLTLFIFYEVLTLSTFPLVTHKGTEAAMKAGRVYLGILIATSICLLLPAIIWTWHISGTTTFTPGGILGNHREDTMLALLAALFLFGIGKAAIMPVHRWLPAVNRHDGSLTDAEQKLAAGGDGGADACQCAAARRSRS